MNTTPTVYTAAASSSISLAFVGIVRWLLSYTHVTIPPDVEGDFIVIITSVVHWYLCRVKPVKIPISTPVAPTTAG